MTASKRKNKEEENDFQDDGEQEEEEEDVLRWAFSEPEHVESYGVIQSLKQFIGRQNVTEVPEIHMKSLRNVQLRNVPEDRWRPGLRTKVEFEYMESCISPDTLMEDLLSQVLTPIRSRIAAIKRRRWYFSLAVPVGSSMCMQSAMLNAASQVIQRDIVEDSGDEVGKIWLIQEPFAAYFHHTVPETFSSAQELAVPLTRPDQPKLKVVVDAGHGTLDVAVIDIKNTQRRADVMPDLCILHQGCSSDCTCTTFDSDVQKGFLKYATALCKRPASGRSAAAATASRRGLRSGQESRAAPGRAHRSASVAPTAQASPAAPGRARRSASAAPTAQASPAASERSRRSSEVAPAAKRPRVSKDDHSNLLDSVQQFLAKPLHVQRIKHVVADFYRPKPLPSEQSVDLGPAVSTRILRDMWRTNCPGLLHLEGQVVHGWHASTLRNLRNIIDSVLEDVPCLKTTPFQLFLVGAASKSYGFVSTVLAAFDKAAADGGCHTSVAFGACLYAAFWSIMESVPPEPDTADVAEGSRGQAVPEGSRRQDVAEGSSGQAVAEGSRRQDVAEGSRRQDVAEGSRQEVAEGSRRQSQPSGTVRGLPPARLNVPVFTTMLGYVYVDSTQPHHRYIYPLITRNVELPFGPHKSPQKQQAYGMQLGSDGIWRMCYHIVQGAKIDPDKKLEQYAAGELTVFRVDAEADTNLNDQPCSIEVSISTSFVLTCVLSVAGRHTTSVVDTRQRDNVLSLNAVIEDLDAADLVMANAESLAELGGTAS
jgi:hypothetical protein